jgi:hypothetical protein
LRRASASIEGAKVDPDDVMAAGRELEGEEAGSAPGVERVERAPAGEDEIENSVPGGALGGGADAVAEILVEVRRPPIPVGRDLLLDDVSLAGGHAMTLSLTCTWWMSTAMVALLVRPHAKP